MSKLTELVAAITLTVAFYFFHSIWFSLGFGLLVVIAALQDYKESKSSVAYSTASYTTTPNPSTEK